MSVTVGLAMHAVGRSCEELPMMPNLDSQRFGARSHGIERTRRKLESLD